MLDESTALPRPDTGLSRAAVLVVAFAGFATFLDLYATQPLLPLFESIFRASKAEVGLTISASTAAVALFAPIVGVLGERTARKPAIVLSLVLLAVATLFAATARGLADLVVWRFLQGAAIPGVYVLALAYVTEEASPNGVGRAMAAFVTGNVVGGFSGRALTGVVTEHGGWREAFVVLGVLNLVGAFATWRFLPPSRGFVPRRRGVEPLRARLRAVVTAPLVATLAIGFDVLFALVAAFSYVVFYLSAPPFALGASAVGGVFAVYLVGAVVTPIAGRMIDTLGARTVLVTATLVGAAGMGLTLVPSLAAVVVGLALVCSSAFVCQSASTSQLRVVAPAPLRSLASGLYVTAYYVGGSVGGVLPALVWRRAGWTGCVAVIVFVDLVTVLVALRGWAPTKR